ncbi:hypothetical protein [Streptomyces cavernicola]|uniref:Uncharacterized protein n=1 Tax=Streptomyces cavernicola TaxID=3043613 RepID=A0ABT6SMJ9_9ACTN|nr:hypothetical protein [Streptomyces sp. B-S-A6]MDI3409129.1 hypothetical protein [Streptomyces sp. B-S-A6]
MVTSSHEAMHRIFQHDPGLFSRVSEFLGADIPRPVGATALPTDLTEDSPVERRVDTLLRFDTAEQGPFLLAVEAQGKKALSAALKETPEDIANPIAEFTAQGLGNRPAKHVWRNLVAVDLSFFKSYLAEEIRDEGRAEFLLQVLEDRDLDVPDDVRERITSCHDQDLLSQWLTRALTAQQASDIFDAQA